MRAPDGRWNARIAEESKATTTQGTPGPSKDPSPSEALWTVVQGHLAHKKQRIARHHNCGGPRTRAPCRRRYKTSR